MERSWPRCDQGGPIVRSTSSALARYNPDGTLDTGFGDEGKVVLTSRRNYFVTQVLMSMG